MFAHVSALHCPRECAVVVFTEINQTQEHLIFFCRSLYNQINHAHNALDIRDYIFLCPVIKTWSSISMMLNKNEASDYYFFAFMDF